MRQRKGKYLPSSDMMKLNVSAKPISVKSFNQMKRKSSKSFKTPRRMQKGMTNMSPKSVSKQTKGMIGAGRTFKQGAVFGKRPVVQISPAQFGVKKSPTAKAVASNPRKQNKQPSLNMFKKSLKKSMGY